MRNVTAAVVAPAMPKGRLRLTRGDETPGRSKAEMAALAAAVGVAPAVLPRGERMRHEEFAGNVAPAILDSPIAS